MHTGELSGFSESKLCVRVFVCVQVLPNVLIRSEHFCLVGTFGFQPKKVLFIYFKGGKREKSSDVLFSD